MVHKPPPDLDTMNTDAMNSPSSPRVLIAPDSLKNSLPALDAAAAIERGLLAAWPDLDTDLCPLADGGEGTIDALAGAWGCQLLERQVTGPRGNSVSARWAWQPSQRLAIIELAEASGFRALNGQPLDPWSATSAGTGELIRTALDQKPERLVLTLGGSVTNDGGLGILQALGARLLDAHGHPVPSGLAGLELLASIDLAPARTLLDAIAVDLIADVRNPLLGVHGAMQTYGPQKGLTRADLPRAERCMEHYAQSMREKTGIDPALPGSGAAGGAGFSLAALTGCHIQPGPEYVFEATGLNKKCMAADFIISAEGSLDNQTLNGKLVAGLGRLSRAQGKPLYVLCGRIKLDAGQLDRLGVSAAFPIVPGPTTEENAIQCAADWMERTATQLGRLLHTASRHGTLGTR